MSRAALVGHLGARAAEHVAVVAVHDGRGREGGLVRELAEGVDALPAPRQPGAADHHLRSAGVG